MSDFEHTDHELSSALERRAGVGPASIDAAHDAVLARAGHIRRRRAAVSGGVAILAVVAGGFLLMPRSGTDTLAPSETGDVLPSVDVTDGSSPDDQGTSSTSTVPGVGPAGSTTTDAAAVLPTATSVAGGPTTTVGSGSSQVGDDRTSSPTSTSTATPTPTSTATSTATSTPPSTPTSTPTSTTSPSSTPTSSTPNTASSTSVAPATIPPFTKTYQSTGGSITVNWNGSSFSLQAVAPAAGFTAEIEDETPLRIRVRFRGDVDESRIEVRISDGQLVETIS